MYLSEVFAENFRLFGAQSENPGDDKSLRLDLQPGINALVGENDSGKTAIIDAIRYCLWTTSLDYHRFTDDDFHCSPTGRATELTIRCKFTGLSDEERASFLEWLTTPAGKEVALYVTLRARRLNPSGGRQRIAVTAHAGERGEGPALEGAVREMIRSTYLRPLRDADSELRPGRNSRLSQILASHPQIAAQNENDFDTESDRASTLVGIMRRAEHHVQRNQAVESARDDINTEYLDRLSIADDKLLGEIGVAGSSLRDILEKLELRLCAPSRCSEWTQRGLGFNNALFMAAELLLLGASDACPTLLIEEPEAHLHPQLQARVIELLEEKSKQDARKQVQIILTTHSPNLASSLPLERVTLVCGSRTYSLAPQYTLLDQSDYAFLERFLDVTKANLFFAKGVVIVEGDAENLLLPAIAGAIGKSFNRYGVSVVNVGHVGLFRYSNVFRRATDPQVPVKIACLRDRDVAPDDASDKLKRSLKRESDLTEEERSQIVTRATKHDGGPVRTFLCEHWTFEYDLARSSWTTATLMYQAVKCAKTAANDTLDDSQVRSKSAEAAAEVESWKTSGKSLGEVALAIYAPLREGSVSKAIAAQYAAKLFEGASLQEHDLPAYLRDAIQYVVGSDGGA